MSEDALKIRFRLPHGEEFEAEGPQDFIETQRNYFLNLIGHTAATRLTHPAASAPAAPYPEIYLWERLFKEEEGRLVLRQKPKLPAPDIALLLLAGTRVLLKQTPCPALVLARSLKSCGISGGRLDRLLAGEIQAGRITARGVKRSRTYQLTDNGFARAFVLAEKLQQF